MKLLPGRVLRKMYNHASLRNTGNGVRFSVKNRLSPVSLQQISRVSVNGDEIPATRLRFSCNERSSAPVSEISPEHPLDFPLGTRLTLDMDIEPLRPGRHGLEVAFSTRPYGRLRLEVTDVLNTGERNPAAIPRDPDDDYARKVISARQAFIEGRTGVKLEHTARFSIDPAATRGNIENFTGAAQVPLGYAGPLRVEGQHAYGEFYVPLATSEGTLVASYNRGMKVLHRSGGVKCTVVGDHMQRAPAFVFRDAARAREFADWLVAHTGEVKAAADATDPFVSMTYIDHYLANKFAFLRFNFRTGDAAGMNMVGKAAFAACNWILENCDVVPIERFFLEANFATDKKASMINMMRTRGKRVTAEVTVRRDALREVMDADTESLYAHYKAATIGTMLSGANNNGCHAANAITAIFIATGQDVANVAESSMGLLYSELTRERDLYMSITLPALIVATCGGGTGLPTQREALESLGCYGPGKVFKFAEIVAGTVLAGEISLAAAISSLDWISSHDELGRNDPLAGAESPDQSQRSSRT